MNKKGFTLIELLIVVAIIGIIAAIAIPNLLVAIQKSKQKATMGDMKTLGTAIGSYITDSYIAPPQLDAAGFGGHPEFYMPQFPRKDAWGGDWQYLRTNQDGLYTLRSWGKDQAATAPVAGRDSYVVTSLGDFNNDIIYMNGAFTWGPRVK